MLSEKELLPEMIRYLAPYSDIPKDADKQWGLFRALINMRHPQPISDDFIALQDRYLQARSRQTKITSLDELTPIKENIYVWQGDITTLRVDAIVNAANSQLLGCFIPNHACIDNAIHTFAGIQLRMACTELMERQGYPEPIGRAKITLAYNLPSNYVIHTVGPIIHNVVSESDCRLLQSCYEACLQTAVENGVHSLAFCCISTGEFHFPNDSAAHIAVETVEKFLKNQPSLKVVFNVFKDADKHFYQELLAN